MFIINLTYIKPIIEIEKYLKEHSELLELKYKEGLFIFSGRKNPRTGGIILVNTDQREKVEEFIESDPFNREQLAKYEIIEFIPTKTDPRFIDLIKT